MSNESAIDPWAWDELNADSFAAEPRRRTSIIVARAAIEAMSEPTEAMIEAGASGGYSCFPGPTRLMRR